MTEPKSEIQPAAIKAATDKTTTGGAAAPPSTKNTAKNAVLKPKKRSMLGVAFFIVLLFASALAAALWYQHKTATELQTALLSQVQSSTKASMQASQQAQQALDLAQAQSAQISALQKAAEDSDLQLSGLEQAFQLLTDSGSDLVLINDIDHLVTVAHQQLLLGGNVANAIVALETAQAQLARANRPNLAVLLQAINGDLDRLRAVSTIDVALLSTQLNELGVLISQAPLLVPDQAVPNVDTSDRQLTTDHSDSVRPLDPNLSWWENSLEATTHWLDNAWSSVRQDLGSFISVRRVQDSSALLLSPDQASQLRENLRLRIMTAQLALMMHQPDVWKTDTQVVLQALKTRYDVNAADSQRALKLAQQLADTSIAVKLPTVNNSIQTLEALRQAGAKEAEQKASPSSLEPDADSPQADPLPESSGDEAPSLPSLYKSNGQSADTQLIKLQE